MPGDLQFWHKRRVRRLSFTVLCSILTGLVIAGFTDSAGVSMVRRGDFPAFYSAAVLVARQRYDVLYDQVVQQLTQVEFWPSLSESYMAFPYPPFVALLLSPLALLPPLGAKVLTCGLMLLCVWLSVQLGAVFIPVFRESSVVSFVCLLLFSPVFIDVFGGQNVALSMLLFAAGTAAIAGGEKPRELLAGFCFGLWLFKPQLGGLALIFLALGCRPRFLLGAAIPALGYYLMAVPAFGFLWPYEWLNHAGKFSAIDQRMNRFQMISLASLTETLTELAPDAELLRWILWASALLLGLLITTFTAAPFIRARGETDTNLKRELLVTGLMRAAPAIALISPHTLFYDLGLIVFPVAKYFELRSDLRVTIFVVLLAVAFFLGVSRELFPVTPIVLYPLATLALCYCRRRK